MRLRFAGIVALAALAAAQQGGQKKADTKSDNKPPEKKEPAPLFGGQLSLRSSQKTKESATLGFNGIDPSGKVDAKMLATSPGEKDREKVKQMHALRPTEAQLQAFLKEGGLKQK